MSTSEKSTKIEPSVLVDPNDLAIQSFPDVDGEDVAGWYIQLQAHERGEDPRAALREAYMRRVLRIPVELRALPQWVVSGADKEPMRAAGGHASVKDPSTWTSFETAATAAFERGTWPGFVLTAADEFACIDLDVKDATSHPDKPEVWTTPAQRERFNAIVEALGCYTERSRSGKGLHIWARGNIGTGCRRDGVEVYSQGRHIVCTGDTVHALPVDDRLDLLLAMAARMSPVDATDETTLVELPEHEPDAAILDRLFREQENGAKWRRMLDGQWEGELGSNGKPYGSQSEADDAILSKLTFYSSSNAPCRRIHRASQLGQWDTRRNGPRDKVLKDDRYLNLSLRKRRDEQWREQQHVELLKAAFARKQERASGSGQFFTVLTDEELTEFPDPSWCIKEIVPDTGIGVLFGDSGVYKGFLVLDMLANASDGLDWFGKKVTPCGTLYLPFEGQGGLPKRVRAWRKARQRRTKTAFITEPMNLRNKADRDKLVATLQNSGWPSGIICIDTLSAAGAVGGNFDDIKQVDMGEVIGAMKDLQARLGGAVFAVHHTPKGGKDERGHGSLRAAVDFSIYVERDPEWPQYNARFSVRKQKEGEEGLQFDFSVQRIVLGVDGDGDEVSSLVVASGWPQGVKAEIKPPPELEAPKLKSNQEDDDFVWQWIGEKRKAGAFPSRRSLVSSLPEMSTRRPITKARLENSIARLLEAGTIADEQGGRGGGKVLRAIDRAFGANTQPS